MLEPIKQLKYLQGCGEKLLISFIFLQHFAYCHFFLQKHQISKFQFHFVPDIISFSRVAFHFVSLLFEEKKIDFVFFSNILFSLAIQLASRSRGVRHSVG